MSTFLEDLFASMRRDYVRRLVFRAILLALCALALFSMMNPALVFATAGVALVGWIAIGYAKRQRFLRAMREAELDSASSQKPPLA